MSMWRHRFLSFWIHQKRKSKCLENEVFCYQIKKSFIVNLIKCCNMAEQDFLGDNL